MKNILTSILLILVINGNAQTLKALEYYQLINKAELAICDASTEKAHQYYVSAFKMNMDKPFSIDLLNFFKCSMDIKKYGDAEWSMKRLMSRGFTNEMSNELLVHYKGDDAAFIKKLLAKYPNDTTKFKHPFNVAVSELMVSDKGVRFHFAKLNDGKYMVDSVYKVDSMNATLLKIQFEKYGVLNEDSIGNNFGHPPYNILLLHHKAGFIGGKPFRLLDTLMFEAILKYNVRPELIAQYFNSGSYSYLLPWTLNDYVQSPLTCSAAYFNDEVYLSNFDTEKEKWMDKSRTKMGLCTLNEMRKKELYESRSKITIQQKSKYFFNCGINGATNLKSLEDLSEWKKMYQASK